MNWWIPSILMAVALAAVPVSRRWTGDYFSAPSLIVTAWCGSVALFVLRLLAYPPLHVDTVWLLAGTMVLMAGGAALTTVAGAEFFGRRAAADVDADATAASGRRIERWVLAFALIGLAGVAWYLIEIQRRFGLALFVTEPQHIRYAIGTGTFPSTFLFLELFCIAAPVLAASCWLSGVRFHAVTWIAIVCSVAATWLTTDRTHFFTLLLSIAFMWLFRLGPTLRLRRVFQISAVALLVLALNFVGIAAWRHQREHVQDTGLRLYWPGTTRPLPALLQTGTTAYLYVTGSYAALDTLLNQPDPLTYGLHTIYPLGRALERTGLIARPMPNAIAPYRNLGLRDVPAFETNVYTFLYYPLTDFGRGGALLYALAIGLVSGGLYAWARARRADAVRAVVWGQWSTALVLTIFVNKFNNTAFWYVLLMTVLPFVMEGVRRWHWPASLAPSSLSP